VEAASQALLGRHTFRGETADVLLEKRRHPPVDAGTRGRVRRW
jgi:hypothetical protein